MKKLLCLMSIMIFALVSAAQVRAEDKLNAYPLAIDPVTDAALGDAPVIYTHEGRELRFASDANLETFKKDPKQYVDKVDKLIAEQQLATYPIKTCPISKEELGGMGKPVNVVVNNRLVVVCCKGCKKKVISEPAPIFAQIDKAIIEAQKPIYALKTCIVTDAALDDKAVDYVFAGKLVRLSSEATIAEFNKNPAKYLAKLDAAAK